MLSGDLQYSFACITRSGRLNYPMGPRDFWKHIISAKELAEFAANVHRTRFHLAGTTLGAPADDPFETCGLFVDEQRIDAEVGNHNASSAPAQTPRPADKREENKIAIELVAQELRANPNPNSLTKVYLLDLVKDSGRCGSHWTKYRFNRHIWKQARKRAGLTKNAPGGRRPGT